MSGSYSECDRIVNNGGLHQLYVGRFKKREKKKGERIRATSRRNGRRPRVVSTGPDLAAASMSQPSGGKDAKGAFRTSPWARRYPPPHPLILHLFFRLNRRWYQVQ